MKFPHSKLATDYLGKLKGVEIGGSAHNSYDLDVINVDYTDEMTVYKQSEIELCGEFRKVDVVADASNLPFEDKSFDFVISSHVLEHLFDPIAAIHEWRRVARKYIFITVPRKDLTFDKDKPVTELWELIHRYHHKVEKPVDAPADDHWTIWDAKGFLSFCELIATPGVIEIEKFQELDDKVGNGMTVLFKLY